MITNTDKVVAVVYESYDYDKFLKMDNNRIVTDKRKNDLIESISIKDVLNPIIVNRKMQIVEGQGRYEARKELRLPIIYIISEDADITDCRRLNTYSTNWNYMDYVRSWANEGNENYINLIRAAEETKASIFRIIRLSEKSLKSGGKNGNPIYNGKLTFTEKDIEKAKNVLKNAKEIQDALLYQGKTNSAYYSAVAVITGFKGYNHNRMLDKCAQWRAKYVQMSSLGDQLKQFSEIYNYKTKAENRLYFEDYMRNKGYNVRSYKTGYQGDCEDVSTLKKNNE